MRFVVDENYLFLEEKRDDSITQVVTATLIPGVLSANAFRLPYIISYLCLKLTQLFLFSFFLNKGKVNNLINFFSISIFFYIVLILDFEGMKNKAFSLSTFFGFMLSLRSYA